MSSHLIFAPVTAPFNEIPEAYVDHVSKFLPILRQPEFALGRAADYLQSLCDGTLVRMPLLDLHEFLGCSSSVFFKVNQFPFVEDSVSTFQKRSGKVGRFLLKAGVV